MTCNPSTTNCSVCGYARLSAAAENQHLLWNPDLMGDIKSGRWKIGERVATPRGFIAEIVSLTHDKALVRYLSSPPGPGEIELPLGMLRPATARDLLFAGITK